MPTQTLATDIRTEAALRAALTDAEALALTLFAEAAREPVEGLIAVACVIRNRVRDTRRFSRTFKGVCHQPQQFSCWNPGPDPNHQRLLTLVLAVLDRTPLPLPPLGLAVFQECEWVATGVLTDLLRDNTGGATHYYAPKGMKPRGRVPDWAVGHTPSVVIGGHRFYRGIA